MPFDYVPLVTPPATRDAPVLGLTFQGAQIAVMQNADRPVMPCCAELEDHGPVALSGSNRPSFRI